MKKEFKQYLDELQAPETLVNRVDEIIGFYSELWNFDPKTIFVTDSINEDGARIHDSLFLINDAGIAEAKNFLYLDDFDFVPIDKILSWNIASKNYNFIDANAKSRVTLRLLLLSSITFDMKSAQNNCDYLMKFHRDYVIPRTIN